MYETYFSFKGLTSASFGLSVQTVSEPITAAVKQKIHVPEFRDGSIDFSGLTGTLKYEDKVFEYKCSFKCAGLTEFKQKVRSLGEWLTGKGTLITTFGETYSNARCYGGITTAPQLYGQYGEFNVSFAVKPFADEE